MGTKHKDIAVRVVYSKDYCIHGVYNNFCSVRRSWLLGNKSKRLVNCDGCIGLRVIQKSSKMHISVQNPIRAAETIWEIAAHEFGHAKDDQAGHFYDLQREGNGRSKRKAHDKRAIEISVFNQLYDKGVENPDLPFSQQITLPKKAQEAIMGLAEWYDGNWTVKMGGLKMKAHFVQFHPAASPKIKETET